MFLFICFIKEYPKYRKSLCFKNSKLKYSHSLYISDYYNIYDDIYKYNDSISLIRENKYTLYYKGKNSYFFRDCPIFFKIENGILHLSALDGFKLAYREYDLRKMEDVQIPQEDITFIVPGKSLTELLKLLTNDNETVNLELTDKHIIVNFENVSFFSRLIDGEFIDYNRFIPKDNKTVITVETSKLIKSAERASLIINEKAKTPVKFNFNENGINVNCATVTGRIFDEVEAEFEGVGVELAFNVKYVLDTLRACPEKVRISLSTPHSAMLITPADEENKFVYLVLPVSIKN